MKLKNVLFLMSAMLVLTLSSFDVTDMTSEEIANEGWSFHKYDKRYNALLVCNHCTAYYEANF